MWVEIERENGLPPVAWHFPGGSYELHLAWRAGEVPVLGERFQGAAMPAAVVTEPYARIRAGGPKGGAYQAGWDPVYWDTRAKGAAPREPRSIDVGLVLPDGRRYRWRHPEPLDEFARQIGKGTEIPVHLLAEWPGPELPVGEIVDEVADLGACDAFVIVEGPSSALVRVGDQALRWDGSGWRDWVASRLGPNFKAPRKTGAGADAVRLSIEPDRSALLLASDELDAVTSLDLWYHRDEAVWEAFVSRPRPALTHLRVERELDAEQIEALTRTAPALHTLVSSRGIGAVPPVIVLDVARLPPGPLPDTLRSVCVGGALPAWPARIDTAWAASVPAKPPGSLRLLRSGSGAPEGAPEPVVVDGSATIEQLLAAAEDRFAAPWVRAGWDATDPVVIEWVGVLTDAIAAMVEREGLSADALRRGQRGDAAKRLKSARTQVRRLARAARTSPEALKPLLRHAGDVLDRNVQGYVDGDFGNDYGTALEDLAAVLPVAVAMAASPTATPGWDDATAAAIAARIAGLHRVAG